MGKVWKSIIACILIGIVVFLSFSFINNNFDFSSWPQEIRKEMIMLHLKLWVIIVAILYSSDFFSFLFKILVILSFKKKRKH